MRVSQAMLLTAAGLITASGLAAQPGPTLDYGFYKQKVEPIFLAKRAGHTRCVVCHAEGNNFFRLERPASGEFSDEQSRKNFDRVTKLVNPGSPDTSRLLLHPLAPESGGDVYHSGGRQFADKDDPAWKTMAEWIIGAKLSDH